MTFTSRRMLVLLTAVGTLAMTADAQAHNELTGSDPAGDAVLSSAPAQVVLRFAKPAPLNTASVEAIDASGNRTEVTALTHSPAGDTEIVAPLPSLPPGAATVRWRLVGPDGHPVTGRVALTIAGVGAPTQAPAATEFEESWQVPGPLRWGLRWVSYVALIALGGIMGAAAWLLPTCWRYRGVRTAALAAVAAIGALALAQLLVLAGDIAGGSPLSGLTELGPALQTTAGSAFGVRLVAAAMLAFALTTPSVANQMRWWIASGLFVVLLGSWAFAGHSSSMRWGLIGVPLDVGHHAAAALWLGGLVVVGRLGLANGSAEAIVNTVQRFARLAPIAVAVLVGTGLVQSLRLTGVSGLTLAATHTQLLVIKLAALALMLKVADINRKRVARRFSDARSLRRGAVTALRRAMVVELSLGLIVVGLTASMVVSPPPVAGLPSTGSQAQLLSIP